MAVGMRQRLGSLWLMLDPIFYTLVYYLVFDVLRANPNTSSIIIGIGMMRVYRIVSLPVSLQYQIFQRNKSGKTQDQSSCSGNGKISSCQYPIPDSSNFNRPSSGTGP